MTIGTWNIRSMKNKEIELAQEFEKSQVQLLAITETKTKGQGSLELEGGHLLIYSGVPQNLRAEAGVACLVRKDIKTKIKAWSYISERILTVELIRSETVKETIVVVYGPSEDEKAILKDEFWEKLQTTLDNSKGKIYILGDLNARVGRNNSGIEDILGIFGEPTINSNGKRLLDFCRINNLIVSNSFFEHKDIHKYTRVEPSRKEKSIIDYILIEKERRKSLCDI